MNKIEKINNLLNCNAELEKYIYNLENSSIQIPSNLEEELLQQLGISKSKNIFNENALKVLKIAACTIFALIMWNYMFLFPTKTQPIEIKPIDTKRTENFKDKLKIANDFLLTPLNFERNDK